MGSIGRFIASTRLIALLTLGSRVLGLLRECLLGYFFSTSELLSAFRIAFMVPNLARRLFGEGALSSAMIPVLSENLQTKGEEASRRLVGTVLTLLVLFLAAVVVVAELGLAVWRSVQPKVVLNLAALLLPYMVAICAVAVASGVLNVRHHFAAPAAAPMILNLAIISGGLIGGWGAGLRGLPLLYVICVAVLVGGMLQALLIALALRGARFFPRFGMHWRDPAVGTIFKLMAPMIVGLAAVQLNSLADYLIAYFFISTDQGRVGPAVLGFAQYLYQLPLGVFGIALATAIFPLLSAKAANADQAGLADVLARGIRLSLFIALPAAVGLIMTAQPLVATLYQRGEFDAADTARVAGTLVFYSLGLPAYFLVHVLVRTFYAQQDSRTPARVAASMVALNLTLNLLLVFKLQERGLALATALSAALQAVWLWHRLRSRVSGIPVGLIARGVGSISVATVFMAGALLLVQYVGFLQPLLATHHAVHLTLLVVTGVVVYGVAARLLGLEELGLLLRRGQGE